MKQFAPRIRNKATGEVSDIGLMRFGMRFGQEVTIYNSSDGSSYTDLEGLIGTDDWRDIEEVEMLIPTGLYDENEEMIYVASFEELHELVIKNHRKG